MSRKQHKRGTASSFGQKLYEVNKDGSVVILTASAQRLPGSPFTTNDHLSTDETEVRLQVLQIEKGIQDRAMKRYQRMLEENKEDMLKTAAHINDITFKYRIQNGGVLGNQTSS